MNVLFVSVDTTRADHVGCYGHPEVKTPNIDRLAAEGTRFAQCISPIPITLPSHSSMMTGSYQYVHGARDNGTFVLGPKNVTLAEIFKEAGYATHAEVAAVVLNRRYGLNQGFDSYGDLNRRSGNEKMSATSQASEGPVTEEAATHEAEPEAPSPWDMMDRKGDEITRYGIELLRKNKDRRFFIFLHYYDPHQNYAAPERFANQYEDGYLAEIAFFDEQFGLLLDALRDLGLSEKTLVVLTSDHGEGKGQHGEGTHSYFVYDTTLHVPLILWSPGQVPAGQVVASQVRLIDLAPTILDFVDLEATPQMQGRSLLALLADPSHDLHLPAYADTLAPQLIFGYSTLRCIRDAGWKYIHSTNPELYQVSKDPMEMFNLIRSEPDRTVAMREQLQAIIADSPPAPSGRATRQVVDAEELKKLQALGYLPASSAEEDEELFSGGELDDFDPKGVHPRERLEEINLMNNAMGMMFAGSHEEAEKAYRRLLESEPDNVEAIKRLGGCLVKLKKLNEAELQFRRAVELTPLDALARLKLGRLLAIEGKLKEGERELRQAVRMDPTHHEGHLHLGDVLGKLGRFSDAIVEYEAAESLAPDNAIIPLKWCMALRALGRLKDAEVKVRRARELDPANPRAGRILARLHWDGGRKQDAIEEMLAVLSDHPKDAHTIELLGMWYTDRKDFQAAAKYFKRAAELFPKSVRGFFNTGRSFAVQDELDRAIEQYRKVLEIKPNHVAALAELARGLETKGLNAEAIQAYERLLDVSPRRPALYRTVANMLDAEGRFADSVAFLRRGISVLPKNPNLANDLAWRLATCSDEKVRDGAMAVELAESAVRITGDKNANSLDTLGAAYAEAGRFEEAVETIKRAMSVAQGAGDKDAVSRMQLRLELYKSGQPYHGS